MKFNFNEIPGNDRLKEELVRLISQGKMPHTSLFFGPEGSAKLRFALATARLLLCQGETGHDVCETCSSCRKTAQLAHPDLHFCFPTIGSKSISDDYVNTWREIIKENPDIALSDWLKKGGFQTSNVNLQGNLSTENITTAMNKLKLKSYEGQAKVLILWMPELLGKEGNRVLKLLEEPPDNTFIILVAEDLQPILPTILSRTQIFRVDRYSNEEIIELLKVKGVDEERARFVAAITQGNYNHALKLAFEEEEDSDTWNLAHWAMKIRSGNAAAIIKMAEDFQKLNSAKRKNFLKHCALQVDLALKTKLLGNVETSHLSPQETEFIRNFANALETGQYYALISLLDKAIYYVERNVNPRILFVALSYKMENYFTQSVR